MDDMDDIAALPLVDHHCHGVVRHDLGREEFESLLTEGSPGPRSGTLFDSAIGFAVRHRCAPVLDLPAHADPDDYLERRAELGVEEVNARFLRAAGLGALCVDTGIAEPLLTPAELGELADAPAYEVVRLEAVAESLAAEGTTAGAFPDAFRARLLELAGGAVAFKSIAAYRAGLELSGERPGDGEVTEAARRWLSSGRADDPPKVADETLHRFLIWCAAEHGLPIQFHIAYGDDDVHLDRANPLLLTDLLQALKPADVPVMLLHNYPFHREAGYLAQVFPNVFVDVGLAVHNTAHRARTVIEEVLELAPYGKFLFSSDAYGLPEHYYLDAFFFRRAIAGILNDGVAAGIWTDRDAARLARMFTSQNALRAYDLPTRPTSAQGASG